MNASKNTSKWNRRTTRQTMARNTSETKRPSWMHLAQRIDIIRPGRNRFLVAGWFSGRRFGRGVFEPSPAEDDGQLSENSSASVVSSTGSVPSDLVSRPGPPRPEKRGKSVPFPSSGNPIDTWIRQRSRWEIDISDGSWRWRETGQASFDAPFFAKRHGEDDVAHHVRRRKEAGRARREQGERGGAGVVAKGRRRSERMGAKRRTNRTEINPIRGKQICMVTCQRRKRSRCVRRKEDDIEGSDAGNESLTE